MATAALYVRVSSLGQARDGYSLAYQREILQEFCQREGIGVHRVYEDGGRSGSNTLRQGLRQLIADARQERFDTVLIFRVDRFSRDPLDLLALVQELNRRQIRLRSVTEAVDANDPAGELMLTILGAIGKFVRQNIIQNAMLGKRKRAQSGRYTGGGVPFGYTVAAGGRLRPDAAAWWREQSAADTARMIFTLYEEVVELGLGGAAAVADRLTALGVPAPRTLWNAASIAQMLRNPAYAGDLAYNRRSHNLNKPSTVNEPGQWVVVRDAHEAIVDRAQWERVQALRARNRRGGRRPRHREPELLAGHLRCAVCGSALTLRRTGEGGRAAYTCASRYNHARRRDGTCCRDFPPLPAARLERLVWGFVVEMATRDETVQPLAARRRQAGLPALRAAEREVQAARRALAGHGAQEMRITTAFAEGKLPENLWLPQLERLRQEQDALTARAEAAAGELARLQRRAAPACDAASLRRDLRRLLTGGALGVGDRRRVLALVVGDGGIRVSPAGDVDVDVRIPLAPSPAGEGAGQGAGEAPHRGVPPAAPA